MDQSTESLVTVSHTCHDGWHTFTSEQIPGLFLTGRADDLEQLYHAVPETIAELARADFGMNLVVTPEMTFSSYFAMLPPAHHRPTSHSSVLRQAA